MVAGPTGEHQHQQEKEEPARKRPCLESMAPPPTIVSDLPASSQEAGGAAGVPAVLIGTHDGNFHCDEALAIAMLRLLPAYRDAVVLRTRDLAKLAECHVVVDVGAEYDPERLRFDHHQRGFTHTLGEGYATKLSSAGLVYKHFGKEVLAAVVRSVRGGGAADGGGGDDDNEEELLTRLFKKVYVEFMEHIDGIDNGITVGEGDLRYKVETHLPARVGHLNPAWNEDSSPATVNERFGRAMALVGAEFVEYVTHLVTAWWPARQLVAAAFADRARLHASGQVLFLKQYCPWADHLFQLEEEAGVAGLVKYVLYDDAKGTMVRIHAVPAQLGSFELRLPLPEKWRGVRDDQLSEVAGIPGCTFVHANGFIGGNKTMDGALKMVEVALQEGQKGKQ